MPTWMLGKTGVTVSAEALESWMFAPGHRLDVAGSAAIAATTLFETVDAILLSSPDDNRSEADLITPALGVAKLRRRW